MLEALTADEAHEIAALPNDDAARRRHIDALTDHRWSTLDRAFTKLRQGSVEPPSAISPSIRTLSKQLGAVRPNCANPSPHSALTEA